VGFIPVQLRSAAGLEMRVDLAIALCFTRRSIILAPIPQAGIFALAEISTPRVPLAYGGLGIRANVVRTTFVPQITFGLTADGAIRVCLTGDIETIPLEIKFYWFFNIFLCISFRKKCFSVGFGRICIPIPYIKWCGEKSGNFYKWGLSPIRKRLFHICTGAYDRSPPQRGSIDAQ